ncbi:MAG: carbohydrate kinase family protein [Clostridia bacterium]|nr:carbohydrate kinase family protein [Clostridia bacterium]
MGIVVIGASFIDIKGYPQSQYIPAGRNVGRVVTVHGGVSRNIVEDIANVELRPTFVSVTDDTALGRDVVEKLQRHKVDTRFIRTVPDGLGTWLAIFDNSGDVVSSISKRPDLTPLLDILSEHGDEIFEGADSIAVEIDMDADILREVFRLAAKHDKRVYAVVSNMSIAVERRDLIKQTGCFVCNQQEAGIFFSEDYDGFTPEKMLEILPQRVQTARISRMVVTMGGKGAVYADIDGNAGIAGPINVDVLDTTGAGDSFFAGVTIGLTYGKSLGEACDIGSRLAASVIVTKENVCPRFLPDEFDIDFPKGQ